MSAENEYKDSQHLKTDFVKVSKSSQFKELIRDKKRFTVPLTIFFLIFYFTLPILASYSNVLEVPAIGDITWAWIFAFAQFIMTWTLCTIFVKKSASFDKQSEQIIEDQLKEDKGGN